MNTIENRMISRLKVMERLKTNLPWMGNQAKNLGSKGISKIQTEELPSEILVEESVTMDPPQDGASDLLW